MKFVATISKEKWTYGGIRAVLQRMDCKQAVIGIEVGRSGYEHFQLCIDCGDGLPEYIKKNNCGWHIENCISWERAIHYCRKEGKFHDLGFRDSALLHRSYRPNQQDFLNKLASSNDRQIVVWMDVHGNAGKSTVLYNLARSGQVLPIPRSEQSAQRLTDFVAMMYDQQEYIILDLPRNAVLTPSQAEALESIKDGLVCSAKYEGAVRCIKGVKVGVMTNQQLPKKTYEALTPDRWLSVGDSLTR